MSNNNNEVKKEELLEQKEARKLTEEELEQVTGGKEQLVAPTDGATNMSTFTVSLVSLSESK